MFETLFKYPFETYARGELVYLSRIPGELRLLFFAGFVALVWYLYRSVASKVDRRERLVLVSLRLAACALVFFVLGMPALRSLDPRDRSFFTAVLVDTSRSMSIEDVGAPGIGKKLSRIDAARQVLLGQDGDGGGDSGSRVVWTTSSTRPGLLSWLDDRSKLLVYQFDSGARRHERGKDFEAAGGYTNIFRSVRDMDAELRALPLVAVVMLTDGCRTVGGPPEDASRLLASRGVPLYIVGLGRPDPARDYEVVHVVAPRRVRRNTEVEVQMTLRHTGFDRPFKVRITRDGNEVLSEVFDPAETSDLKLARVTFTPDHRGTATYTVEIPPDEAELIAENNKRDFILDIKDDRLPVLYIEGSPREEYRFLRRAMFRDPDFRVVGILRLASDRFYVQGANESETYLQRGFPKTREELFAFQAVILGDIEAGYFSPAQLAMLKEFVQVRGGGMLMLGGVNSFGSGRYAGTPVGKMLPLVISGRDPPYSDQKYNPTATPEGLRHPVMRLSANPAMNSYMWEHAPPLMGITPVRGVKPGASLLIVGEGRAGGRPPPVLAVQNYGAGRAAAFTSGGSWYWQVSMPASNEFHERFWKQLIRWLVMGAKEQLTVTTDNDIYGRGEAAIIRAQVLGKDLRPVNDAEVVATVTDPLGNAEDLVLHWILSEEGVYQCRYCPAEPGSHTVSVRARKDEYGWRDLKAAVTGFMVTEPMVEFSDSNLKEDLLRRMARATGGGYYGFPAEPEGAGEPIEKLIDKLKKALDETIRNAETAGAEVRTSSLWDMPLLYVLLVGLMGAEWMLRRRSGLA